MKWHHLCILCGENIIFNEKGYQCVGHKGLSTINDYTRKYNELNPEPKLIHVFEENEKKYVPEACRKTHSNNRRYEQVKKRKDEFESASARKLRFKVKHFSFHTDCYICGKCVDQEKARRFLNFVEYEFSRVMMVLNVKYTILWKDVPNGAQNKRRVG